MNIRHYIYLYWLYTNLNIHEKKTSTNHENVFKNLNEFTIYSINDKIIGKKTILI
jgi:hypothetical protein